MARSEDGEFELILGNKQLLSVFFVVVMLLGVFFAMGYIVGKNSMPSDVMAAKRTEPIIVDPTNPTRSPYITPSETKPPVEPVRTAQPPVSIPKDDPPVAKNEPPKVVEPVKIEPKKEPPKVTEPVKQPEPPKVSEPPKRVSLTTTGEPSGGTFFQVVASTRPDCEIIVDVLKRKGYQALIAPGPNDKLFRVLVGPLNDPAAVASVRAKLEGDGFSKPYLRKY